MVFEILYETIELIIPHDEMTIAIRRAGMYEIEIYLLTGIWQREISISPHSLDKIISIIR